MLFPLLIVLCNAAALCLLMRWAYQRGRAQLADLEGEATALDLGENPAQSLLSISKGVDVLALVSCEIISNDAQGSGLISQELRLKPCFSTKTGTIEPCLLEVSKGLRFLADRIDEQVNAAGFSAGEQLWLPMNPKASKAPLN